MQHLAVLEGSGLVRTEKVGRVRSCTLDGAALATVDGWLTDQRRWERRLDRPGAFLSEEAPGAGSEASAFTEQGAYRDGDVAGREEGTRALLEALAGEIARAA